MFYKLGSFQIVYIGYMTILFVNYEMNQIINKNYSPNCDQNSKKSYNIKGKLVLVVFAFWFFDVGESLPATEHNSRHAIKPLPHIKGNRP